MDQGRAEVVTAIAHQRELLGDDVAELARRFRSATDWRTYFAANTWKIIGLALGFGFLISGAFRRSGR
jgi:hypothetical protein